MSVKDVLLSLGSLLPHEQAAAIKHLKRSVSDGDIDDIRRVINKENSPWLKKMLEGLIDGLRVGPPTEQKGAMLEKDDLIDINAIKSEAISDSIGQVLHELDPIVGSINLYAKREVVNYKDSKIKSELERLEEIIKTFEDWRRVEQAPRYRSIMVYEVVEREMDRCLGESGNKITINLSKDLVFSVDGSLLRIIISNAIRNALESTLEVKDRVTLPILINGGLTDRCLWISVIDDGVGLKGELEVSFKNRFSTKPGHNGFGLAIVNKAISTLEGRWELSNSTSSTRGAVFYFEVPIREF